MLHYVQNYTPSHQLPPISPDLFYLDIETTGLKKENSIIYLIGCACPLSGGEWQLHQWFASTPSEEGDILAAYAAWSKKYRCCCHYNGARFDLPFLDFRSRQLSVKLPDFSSQSRDLYPFFRPLKKLLPTAGLKLKDWMDFLHFERTDEISGKDCVKLYRDMIKYRNSSLAEPLLSHNAEDLKGLIEAESLCSYYEFLRGNFRWEKAAVTEETAIRTEKENGTEASSLKPSAGTTEKADSGITGEPAAGARSEAADISKGRQLLVGTIRLTWEVPAEASFDFGDFRISLMGGKALVTTDLSSGFLKNYYEDFKNYYYLPAEDTAIHKSVGAYVEKSHRCRATQETCCTKFPVTKDFLEDDTALLTYLERNVQVWLSHIRSNLGI